MPGGDLIVFPELYLSGYVLTARGACRRPEVRTAKHSEDSAGEPTVVRRGRGRAGWRTRPFCVDERGTIAAVYRKVQLYKGGESEAFVAGDELLVVELRRIRIGLMICFDVEFPEVARALARGGADLFVTISANMEPFGNDHAVFCSARAIENGLPHVYVNQVGPAGTLNFVGGSTVVSADGEVRAQASSSEEEIPTVSLLLPERSSIREDYLKELRSPMPGVRNVISGAESVTRIET